MMKKDSKMTYDSVLYAVLKLNTNIKYEDPVSGDEVTRKLEGCTGYLPVFDNKDDAKEASYDGKYQIVPITTG